VSTSPAVGSVTEKVIRERKIPPEELAREKRERTTPEFWEFIEAMIPEMWSSDYILYILREDPKPSMYGGTNTLEKCPGYIAMPDGTKQPLNSREDIELAIKLKYGGKAYRLILKKGSERICEGKCINEAPPKYPDANPYQQPQHPLPNAGTVQSDANAIASKAIDTVANQPQEVMNIAINALRASAEMIARSATVPAATAPATPSMDDELNRALRAAMLQKFLAPPPDPFDMLIKFKQAMGDGAGSSNALVEKILSTAVDKLLNPVSAVTGRTTLLDVGREVLPALIHGAKDVMHEYRLSVEAQAHIADAQRNMPQQPAAPSPQVLTAPAPMPAAQPNPPAPAATAPALTFQQIEAHIAKIVKNVEFSTDEAVDKVLEFLYDTDPRLVGALLNPPTIDRRLAPGKQGLLQMFQAEAELQPCLSNVPRLSEFLDKFIVAATVAEEAEARLRAAAPANAAPQPTPA
jgi:hypothetical protein